MKKAICLFFALLLSFSVVIAQNTTSNTTQNEIQEVQYTCNENQCDKGCVKCNDRQCHSPGFECVEEIMMDRFFPEKINVGINQINIVLKNTGSVNLDDLYAIISGDGIETVDRIPLDRLNVGDKDYVFAKINASKPGTIDIVIKIYVAGNVKNKLAEQITVIAQPKVETPEEKVNVTELTDNLEKLRVRYRELEQNYQTKKINGYPVDIIYDKLKEVYSQIVETQSSFIDIDYKKAQSKLGLIKSNLDDIESQLNSVQKQQETFSDKVKNNLLFFGSLAAAVVSIFTAYKLIHSSVDKDKIAELHKKLSKARKKKKK